MQVEVRLLGGFEVAVDGQPIPARDWRRQSASQLVKLLALQPGRRLLRDQVIDTLWPDLSLDRAAPRLHVASHYARTALGSPESVVLSRGSLALFPEADLSVDVTEFEQAADAARESGGRQAAAAAVALYTGPLLPDDLYEPWTEEPRERLQLRYRELLRAAGRYDALVADDPLDEDAQLAMVRDLVRQGRRSDALRSLDRMADLFERELGVEPTPAAQELRAEAEALPVGAVPDSPTYGVPLRRTALPAARNRLVGRATDLDQVAALLQLHRVVTIAGPGGAGKSTLALAHARRVQPEDGTEDGAVVLAELAPVHDEADVTRAVAEAAGVQGEGAVRTSALAANLAARPLLLVLDNCEHLLDASATLVDAILDAGPEARVLVTSREPLRVDGEAVHRIGSLGSESAELFVDRAVAAAGPGVVSVDDPRVADLCARLDGLPLAIELAAAQLGHLTLPELLDRLDDRLTLLTGGRPKAGERHSALAATIAWSYRLLSQETRDVFDRLAVFPADFDLDAVVAVTGRRARDTVTNLLGDLVAKSLVVHDPGTGRYRLLETIRLFAAQRLAESGTEREVTELLRRHVVRRASAVPRVRSWLSASMAARSRDDLDNVRLAFDASLAVGDLSGAIDVALGISTLWRNAVSYTEGRRWVFSLLGRELSPDDRLWALFLAADIGLGSGDPRAMREAATEAAALCDQVDDPGGAVIATIYEALVHLDDPAKATRRLEEARDLAREAGEPALERLARGYRLVTVRMLGPADALEDEVQALLAEDAGRDYDRYLCIWAASLLALVDRDGPRLRRLMDAQLHDLMTSELRENWLTMYWGALALIVEGRDHLPQLRSARRRAEEEGRQVDADCVLALAYAAACRDEWEQAAELLAAVADELMDDTAGFFHLVLVRDQLVRPQLSRDAFAEATARGQRLDARAVLAEHGV